jgi:5-methylcytosine-specific restriction endonuclease McrA
MPVTKRTRYEVLRRDNHTCRYCGGAAPDTTLTVDHVTPVALGGTDDPANLVAACRDCNAGKASTSPDAALVEDVAQDAVRWAAAIKLAAQNAERREAENARYVAAFWDELAGYFPD